MIILQITVKAVLNPRQDEVESFDTIVHPADDILGTNIDGVDAMVVDKDDLEETEAATDYADKAGVFNKEPAAGSAPPAEITPLQTSDASISTITFDKLVVNVAEMVVGVTEVKANQADIKAVVAELATDVAGVKANQADMNQRLT